MFINGKRPVFVSGLLAHCYHSSLYCDRPNGNCMLKDSFSSDNYRTAAVQLGVTAAIVRQR